MFELFDNYVQLCSHSCFGCRSYDEVAELSRGVNMRRVARPDFVPTLTVVANKEATANDDDSSTERSYRCEDPVKHNEKHRFCLHFY